MHSSDVHPHGENDGTLVKIIPKISASLRHGHNVPSEIRAYALRWQCLPVECVLPRVDALLQHATEQQFGRDQRQLQSARGRPVVRVLRTGDHEHAVRGAARWPRQEQAAGALDHL